MGRKSEEHFNQFVEHIFFRNEDESVDTFGYTNEEEDNPPIEDYEGWMYVTTGDDLPWLVIYGPNGFGISLKPALALYWLQTIQEYYQSSNQKVIE